MRCYIELKCPASVRNECIVFKKNMTDRCWECDEAFGGPNGKTKEGCYTCRVYLASNPVPVKQPAKSRVYIELPDGTKDYLSEPVVNYYKLKEGMFTICGYPIKEEKPITV